MKHLICARVLALFVLITIPFLFGCKESRSGGTTQKITALDPITEDIILALKAEYLLTDPPSPPFLSNQSQIVPFATLRPSLPTATAPASVPFLYNNLSPTTWASLRQRATNALPVLWNTNLTAMGTLVTITIDFRTDQFDAHEMSPITLSNLLARMRLGQ